jgi:hypothetical protein
MNTLLLCQLGLILSMMLMLLLTMLVIMIRKVLLDPGNVLLTLLLRIKPLAHASCLQLATSTCTKETLDSLPRWMSETLTLNLPTMLLTLSSQTCTQEAQLELEQ